MAFIAPVGAMAQGQQGSGSPYSAYGLGDLMGSTQVSQAIMGGVGTGLIDPYSVISSNPASYPSLRIPVFETGLVSRATDQRTATAHAIGGRTDLLGLSLGVPVGKGTLLQGPSQPANRWGFAFGLTPVSKVGYQISENAILPSGGSVRYEYTGDGGLNRAFLGLGLIIWQTNDTIHKGTRISLGANLNYLFGSTKETRKAYYAFDQNSYNSNISSRLIVRSPTATVGAQISGDLVPLSKAQARLQRKRADRPADAPDRTNNRGAEPLRYTIGLRAELPASLYAERTELVNSFAVGSSGVEFPYDTLSYKESEPGTVSLPALFGIGFSVYNSRWMIAVEHTRRDWTQFAVRVDEQEFRSQLTVHQTYAIGAGFTPAGDRRGTLFQRTTYKAGLRYALDYRMVLGEQLRETGFGIGLAMPVMANSTRSRVNFGVELAERGSTAPGLLRERSVNVFIGVTITPDIREQWFKKRRLE